MLRLCHQAHEKRSIKHHQQKVASDNKKEIRPAFIGNCIDFFPSEGMGGENQKGHILMLLLHTGDIQPPLLGNHVETEVHLALIPLETFIELCKRTRIKDAHGKLLRIVQMRDA
ncbi:hypothetical protein SDC9_117564 [bioreactor metagenome]|uniref:Uncharacterized protein n=1 Tax=bioreactor metagenome TaxID=1076179 RepID=A0A645BZ38_9ZZZZ